MPTRIVHVVGQLDTGGMEKLLVEFARCADRQRFDVRFISLTTRGRVAREIEQLGCIVMPLDQPPGLRPGFALRLARVFRSWKADVIHAHNAKSLAYCSFAARLARVPAMIYTCHGERFGASRRQNLLFRFTANLVDAAVCVSHASERRCIKDGVKAHRVHTIWNGIDVSRFSYAGPVAGGPVVMVGRLSPEKDVETLLRAIAIATRQEPTLRLLVAGDGPCLRDLKRTSDELGLAKSVEFLGNVSDVPALLRQASMSVLSSLTEGISLTLLEAMSCGLPVVATRVGGNPEVVAENETGMLVPPRDPEALAAAILRVWRNSELGRRMGLAGRHRVEAHFDVRRMIGRYESLYLAALGPRATKYAIGAQPG